MRAISADQLHSSLQDPVLQGISFLNEVMDRYPDAISFAPGAPHAHTFEDFDPSGCIARYQSYLRDELRLSPAQITKRLYQYGPARGLINELLAAALQVDQQISVRPQDLVVTVGAQEGMLLVLRALCRDAHDQVALVNPSFVGIRGAARLLDVATWPVSEAVGGDGVDCEALAKLCVDVRRRGERIRVLYVAPDFANPSGTQMSLAARHELLQLARAHDFFILEDNAYGFTAEKEEELPSLKALDQCGGIPTGRVIYLGTCAKICLPGVRVGFVVADQAVQREGREIGVLADELAALKSMVSVNTSPLCQAMVGGLILQNGGSLAAIGQRKAQLYRRNLKALLKALDRHLGMAAQAHGQEGIVIAGAVGGDLAGAVSSTSVDSSGRPRLCWNQPRGGFFVRMQLPIPVTEELLHVSASRYGVLWTPMNGFYLNDCGKNELRLSCSYLDPQQIDLGVQRLADFLRDPAVAALPASVALGTGASSPEATEHAVVSDAETTPAFGSLSHPQPL